MDLDALLKSQQEWLDRATSALGKSGPGDPDASSPDALRAASIQTARARLARLETQREETMRRLDAAIGEERAVIQRIENLGQTGRDVPKPQGKPAAGRATESQKKNRPAS